ncbi:MAG: transposase, partial [Oligoflexia bacterium]|nr:transposase [Oligoflexia bacterium]
MAISNYRILKLENDEVHFKYRDRKDNNQEKVMVLGVHEFLR